MGASGRRYLTRASGKIARPARALLFGHSRRCRLWLPHPSCVRLPLGCYGPHRTVASANVCSTSRQFGERVGNSGSAKSPGELNAGGPPGLQRDSKGVSEHLRPGCGGHPEGCGGVTWQQNSTSDSDLGARSAGWAVTRCPLFGGCRSATSSGHRPFTAPVHRQDGARWEAKVLAGSGEPRFAGT